jgi:hypothetical protein
MEIFHYKNNPSKCICTIMDKIKDFQYYMHIIWNGPFESRQSWKGGDDVLTYGEKGAWGKKFENQCSKPVLSNAFIYWGASD